MAQPPNPWVTTAEAPGSRRFPERAFVFFNTPQHIKRGGGATSEATFISSQFEDIANQFIRL